MEQMKQCPNGHFYNAEKSATCPYCAGASENANPHTTPQGNDVYSPTQPVGSTSADAGDWDAYSPTMPPDPTSGVSYDKTQAVIHAKTGIDPVVGWLVCCEGSEKGRDYRLHDGNNYIGRSARMDVCINGDEQISRENNAWIAYDTVNKQFLFGGGAGRNLVYLNNKPIVGGQSNILQAYDRIKVGGTTLLFIPMCGEQFDWQ